jgi:hypothetical protein
MVTALATTSTDILAFLKGVGDFQSSVFVTCLWYEVIL